MSHHLSPLRYPGGKTCVFPFIAKLFYENDLIGINYAEPYAGGAGLALKLLINEYVSKIYINDYDKAIYAFWYTILNQKDAFCQWIEGVEVTVDSWRYYKNNYLNSNDLFELAKATFFLNRTNVSGVIKGGIIGGFNQQGKYKIDARFNKERLIARIEKIYRFRNKIHVSNEDGINFIEQVNGQPHNFFVYLDPPYYQKGANLYMNFYSEEDHKKLSKYVHKFQKHWLVSYDNHEFIFNLYPNNKKIIHSLSQSTSNRMGDEIFILPNNLSAVNSLAKLKNASYI